MTTELLFDFGQLAMQKATKANVTRQSGTVDGTVRHTLVHTQSPDATIHHLIMAARPHPVKERSDLGDHYMVAYVSIPMEWVERLTPLAMVDLNISFIGPAGTTQRLPPSLLDIDDLLGDRIYIGFDWLDFARAMPPIAQPSYERIKQMAIDCVNNLRGRVQ